MADKPNINLTLAALEAEVDQPEPFVLALTGSKRITFPDIFNMPADEAESFFADLENSNEKDFTFLAKWLSKADFESYKAAKVPLRVHSALIQKVLSYYNPTMGDSGEGAASASS